MRVFRIFYEIYGGCFLFEGGVRFDFGIDVRVKKGEKNVFFFLYWRWRWLGGKFLFLLFRI